MDLKKLFSKPVVRPGPVLMPSTSESEFKENVNEVPESYKNCNNSLVRKNMALKAEISALHKKLGQLREENQQQREKIMVLESGLDEEKIDLLVAERFQKKMTHLNAITERTIHFLGQAATDYRDFFCDMKTNIENAPSTRSLPTSLQSKPAAASRPQKMRAASNPTLEKVVESPIVRTKQLAASPDRRRAATTSPVSHVTQRRTPRKGRRSGNDFMTGTPRTSRGSTPAPNESPNGSETVRQKRAAASRISSFAEPSLNSKLRRPGKYDEPSPFINTDFV